jgi:hypothetical protein
VLLQGLQASNKETGKGYGKQNVCGQNENMSYRWPLLLQGLLRSSKKIGKGYGKQNLAYSLAVRKQVQVMVDKVCVNRMRICHTAGQCCYRT